MPDNNKKRQELSDQLKQITTKLDQEIMELRKNNNSSGFNPNRSRESNSNTQGSHHHSYISPATTRKKSEGSWFHQNSNVSGSR